MGKIARTQKRTMKNDRWFWQQLWIVQDEGSYCDENIYEELIPNFLTKAVNSISKYITIHQFSCLAHKSDTHFLLKHWYRIHTDEFSGHTIFMNFPLCWASLRSSELTRLESKNFNPGRWWST
jgi:hypothetical protein